MRPFSNKQRLLALTVSFVFALVATAAGQNGIREVTGSYTIDHAASENPDRVVQSVTKRQNISRQDLDDLYGKLEAPESITISYNNGLATIETSAGGAPVTFQTDGVSRSSTRPDGTSVSVRAEFKGNSLTVSSLGGNSDFTLVFTSLEGGKRLSVTRRVTTPYLNETVFAESVYNKVSGYTDDSASSGSYPGTDDRNQDVYNGGNDTYSSSSSSSGDSGGYSDSAPPAGQAPIRSNGTYAVTPGTVVSGTLETLVTTNASQENDPFRITVESPSELRGAVIEGNITGIERTGKITGRSKLTLSFSSITFTNGRRFDFAGVVTAVKGLNGENFSVNNEGQVESRSRTRQTMKRSGLGAGLGAIIGGLLGGGKGALIGATIGAGAGAGSMIPGGKGDLELQPGTTVTISATGPGGR